MTVEQLINELNKFEKDSDVLAVIQNNTTSYNKVTNIGSMPTIDPETKQQTVHPVLVINN